MPRSAPIAVLLALALLSVALPSATAQNGPARPEELWEQFPLDSDKSPPPKPEGQQSPAPEPGKKGTAPPTPAPSEVKPAADEPDGEGGLSLWLLPVGALLAFVGGVFATKAALALTRGRRESAHARKAQARTEPTPARAGTAEPQSLDRSSEADAVAPAAAVATSAAKPARAEPPSRDVAERPPADRSPGVFWLPREAPEESPSEVSEPTRAQGPSPDAVEPTRTEESPPEAPALVDAEQPTPVEAEEPTPVEAEEPAPVEVEEPAPVEVEEPAPVAAGQPALQSTRADKKTPRPQTAPAEVQGAKAEPPKPAPPERTRELPDDVIPFPARPGRVARRPAASVRQRALGYVSAVDADAHGSDLEAQTKEIRAACVRNGFESVEVVRDFESHSGSDLERPGLNYAIERLEAGDASCLVVASLERLTRSAAHLGTLIERLTQNDIRLVVLDIELDTGNPDGRLAAEALANVGTLERRSLDTRTRKGLEAARDARGSSGRPSVADRPALKERIAEMRTRGMTLQAIADTLNAEGVPTLRGGAEWRPSSVQAAVGYKRPKKGARKSANTGAGGESGDGRS
jgi:DNA invertase Pin-like site-specific DNA recombinase